MKPWLLTFFIVCPIVASAQYNEGVISNFSDAQIELHIRGLQNTGEAPLHFWALSLVYDNIPNNRLRVIERELKFITNSNMYITTARNYAKNANKLSLIDTYLQHNKSTPFLILRLAQLDQDKRAEFLDEYDFKIESKYNRLIDYLVHNIPIDKSVSNAIDHELIQLGILFYYYKSSTLLEQELKDHLQKKTNLSNLGNGERYFRNAVRKIIAFRAAYINNDYFKALSKFDELNLKRILPASEFLLKLSNQIRYSYFTEGRYDNSARLYQEYLLPLSKKLTDSTTYAHYILEYGNTLYRSGKINSSQRVYEQLYNSSYSLSPQDSSYLLNNLAATYYKTGESAKYQKLQHDAIQKSKENGEEFSLHYHNLYHYNIRRGNNELAISYLNKAMDLVGKTVNHTKLAKIYIAYAFHERFYNKNPQKALDYVDEAATLTRDEADYKSTAMINYSKAQIYEQMGQIDSAIVLHERLLRESKNKEDRATYYEELVEVARLNILNDNFALAAKCMDKVEEADKSRFDFELLIKSAYLKARLFAHENKIKKARELLLEHIEQVVKRARLSADFKSGYWHVEPVYLDLFEFTVNLLLENGYQQKVAMLLDQFKTINDAALYRSNASRSLTLTSSELIQDKNLTERLEKLRIAYLTSSGDKRFKIEQEMEKLTSQKHLLDQKLNTSRFAEKSYRIDELQRFIESDEWVIHYTKINSSFYITKLSRSDLEITQKVFPDSVQHLIEDSITEINQQSPDLNKLYQIYQYLELDEIPIEQLNRLTFLPDGELHGIPFDILPTQKPIHSFSYGGVRYLIEDVEIRNLTSLQDLNFERSTKNNRYDFIGFGVENVDAEGQSFVPLPHATTEVGNIQSQLGSSYNNRIFTNSEATEKTFRRYAREAGIIHLATHSTVSQANPLFSSIYLTKDTTSSSGNQSYTDHKNDARIFAYELFNLDLSSDLIFFNSCSSGSGKYMTGSGIMGMNRALRYAGVKSSVLNLWSVNDELSSEFAQIFYKNIDEGKTLSTALREAKLSILNEKSTNPYTWGAYTIYGNVDPIDQNYLVVLQNQWLIILLGVLITFALSIYTYHRIKKETTFNKRKRLLDSMQRSLEW